jgi:hypothetical protein
MKADIEAFLNMRPIIYGKSFKSITVEINSVSVDHNPNPNLIIPHRIALSVLLFSLMWMLDGCSVDHIIILKKYFYQNGYAMCNFD